MIVVFFVPHAVGTKGYELLLEWARIIGAFALVLGLGSLFRTHWDKIRRRRRGEWPYSIVTLASFVLMVWAGLVYGNGEGSVGTRLLAVEEGTLFQWLFDNVEVPLDATMFALLSFFIASAAYRTFRARNLEATLLLITAVIVMLGRVPLGEMMHERMPGLYEWIMQYPAVAGKRGILFGVALGSIATSLRIILGIERSHLGG
ncbi:MAG: hypothetical protein GX358_10000 [candidate division WS1 bacterium]|jgi:hypothetical protein|nr:hypothetical protein [candidate division WS1 bacterium]